MRQLATAPPPGLSGRCRIGQETFAEVFNGDGLAPKSASQPRAVRFEA
jgi:hypothetical protein